MKAIRGFFAAALLAASVAAQAGLDTGSTVVFDLDAVNPPWSVEIKTGVDLTIGKFLLDFDTGANGDVFSWTSSGAAVASMGGNTSFVLSGLHFDDGSTLTGFELISSELTDLSISTTTTSLSVAFAPVNSVGSSGTVFSGRYLTSAAALAEPSALALAGIGVAGLALMRQRRR
jgi:multidrug transporter EmrE-like cation transporter